MIKKRENIIKETDKSEEAKTENEKKKGLLYEILKELLSIALLCLIVWLFFSYVLELAYIPTESMHPNIKAGDMTLSLRIGDKTNIKRGTIITFIREDGGMCKRVIGLPGETVSFSHGKVYINGEELDESTYLSSSVKSTALSEYVVPEDCYFCMGDNREISYDSRYWADPFISSDDVESVVFVILPTHSITQHLFKKSEK